MEIQIKSVPSIRMAGLLHRGPFNTISETWGRLMPIAGPAGLFRPDKRTLSYFCEPAPGLPPAEYSSYAGMEFADDVAIPAEMEVLELPSGDYAVSVYQGPYEQLGDAWAQMEKAVPGATGRPLMTGADCYEIYLNDPGSTPPAELLTELYVRVV